ncbi:DUF6755 family protein [Sorangium sp. So ce887]|uniref:DUF6755 family protein n=1 Tax=Sorangium sp. So ce887 TaxID=3133324 RepID=UPI003F631023
MRKRSGRLAPMDDVFAARKRQAVPHEFVLEALGPLGPVTRDTTVALPAALVSLLCLGLNIGLLRYLVRFE